MIKFSNSDTMPLFGLGTWRSTRDETYNSVYEAIKCGYRHIDCAFIYGNEDIVGEAIADAIKNGLVKRSELFITSKLWNDSHEKQHVLPALENTLKDLRLDYLDLYLMHWPVAIKHGVQFPKEPSELLSIENVPIAETWAMLEGCKTKGLCKHIGVSNFNIRMLKELMKTAVQQPEMNQLELHPYLQQPKLVEFCQENNIHVTAYSPLGAGKINEQNASSSLLENPTIISVAKKHSCSPAQALLAWGMARNIVVIPKSVKVERLKENFEAQNVRLDAADMQQIATLDANVRITNGAVWTIEGSYYTQDYLWKE
jgi:alcohol dehydrogenase (NADP+)